MEIIKLEKQKEKRCNKNEESFWDLWDTTQETNMHIVGIPEEKDKRKGREING